MDTSRSSRDAPMVGSALAAVGLPGRDPAHLFGPAPSARLHERTFLEVHRDDVAAADDAHLEPALLVVRLPRVDAGELVVERVDVADVVKRLATALAGEHVVDGLFHALSRD